MTLLEPGDKAPDFKTTDQDGRPVSLKDFAGKKVVLYFYPKDDTPGCTKEACAFRDGFAEFRKRRIEVLGVSADDEKSHKKFAEEVRAALPAARRHGEEDRPGLRRVGREVPLRPAVQGDQPCHVPDRREGQSRRRLAEGKARRARAPDPRVRGRRRSRERVSGPPVPGRSGRDPGPRERLRLHARRRRDRNELRRKLHGRHRQERRPPRRSLHRAGPRAAR